MTRRRLSLAFLLATLVVGASAQNAPPILQEPRTIPLWEGKAPGALGDAPEDVPTLTIYMPPNTAGPMTAVIVAPGGSYRSLSMNKEGRIPATYLNSLGIAAFVLKYRLGPKYHHPIELGDMQRAIRTVRARAAEWHIAPEKVGVMGFSAGGHLASTASTHFDKGSASPTDADRSREQPAGFRHPRLPGDHPDRGVDASDFSNHAARRKAQPPIWRAAFRRRRASARTHHPRSCSTPTRTRPCRWRTAFTTFLRCGKPASRPRCTSSRTARMVSACR